ncbi:hypothetical protein CSUI_008046, partial [Cystoisospora suis]
TSLQATLQQQKARETRLEEELNTAIQEIHKGNDIIAKLQQQIRTFKARHKAKSADCQALEKDVAALTLKTASLQQEVDQQRAQSQQGAEKAAGLTQQCQSLTDEIHQLHQELAAAKDVNLRLNKELTTRQLEMYMSRYSHTGPPSSSSISQPSFSLHSPPPSGQNTSSHANLLSLPLHHRHELYHTSSFSTNPSTPPGHSSSSSSSSFLSRGAGGGGGALHSEGRASLTGISCQNLSLSDKNRHFSTHEIPAGLQRSPSPHDGRHSMPNDEERKREEKEREEEEQERKSMRLQNHKAFHTIPPTSTPLATMADNSRGGGGRPYQPSQALVSAAAQSTASMLAGINRSAGPEGGTPSMAISSRGTNSSSSFPGHTTSVSPAPSSSSSSLRGTTASGSSSTTPTAALPSSSSSASLPGPSRPTSPWTLMSTAAPSPVNSSSVSSSSFLREKGVGVGGTAYFSSSSSSSQDLKSMHPSAVHPGANQPSLSHERDKRSTTVKPTTPSTQPSSAPLPYEKIFSSFSAENMQHYPGSSSSSSRGMAPHSHEGMFLSSRQPNQETFFTFSSNYDNLLPPSSSSSLPSIRPTHPQGSKREGGERERYVSFGKDDYHEDYDNDGRRQPGGQGGLSSSPSQKKKDRSIASSSSSTAAPSSSTSSSSSSSSFSSSSLYQQQSQAPPPQQQQLQQPQGGSMPSAKGGGVSRFHAYSSRGGEGESERTSSIPQGETFADRLRAVTQAAAAAANQQSGQTQ